MKQSPDGKADGEAESHNQTQGVCSLLPNISVAWGCHGRRQHLVCFINRRVFLSSSDFVRRVARSIF